MGEMKTIFTEIQTHLQNHNWGELSKYLSGFPRSHATEYLYGAIELLGEWQTPVSYHTPEIIPARFLEYLEEANSHALHTLLIWQTGGLTAYKETTLEKAYRQLVDTLAAGEKVKQCPNHGGAFDCTPFCQLCEGNQEIGGN